MSDRTLLAYGLIALLVLWLGALIWWRRYHSNRQTEVRSKLRRQKQSDARALKFMAEDDAGLRP
ncbi:hypothetical protein [Croceibacterium aestuarii]|uniref:hypothetical protein n=1 Tax=Croceibacterium aestuarii TaxID=3064139 RepID=UPI00272E98A6|nr:hypothetical protein [Croceibacterium sp. D39]